jgi:hypothetical protein
VKLYSVVMTQPPGDGENSNTVPLLKSPPWTVMP